MKFGFVLLFLSVAIGFFALNIFSGAFEDLLSFSAQPTRLDLSETPSEIASDLPLEEPEKEVSAPAPLRIFQPPAPSAILSTQGVFEWTNVHRQQAQLQALDRSILLDQIAIAKVQDMFSRQYFAHVSPLGVGIGDVAQGMGYEFIAIGENLALGNYAGNEALVRAWMDSPGHRANILSERYEEIGIALQQGMFEGQSTWLAVQVFALPFDACDFPDEELKEEIALEKDQAEELAFQLEQMRAELEAYRPKFGPGYNNKVEEYNALVSEYNNLIGGLKAKITSYNIQVQSFNACAQQ